MQQIVRRILERVGLSGSANLTNGISENCASVVCDELDTGNAWRGG